MSHFYGLLRFLAASILFSVLAGCGADITDVPQAVLDNEKLAKLSNACPSEIMPVIKAGYKDRGLACASSQSSCFKMCRRGDANACLDLANVFVINDDTRAISQLLFKRSCQLGLPSGCTNAAAGLRIQDDLSVNQKICVAESFRKSCKAGDSWGCAMRGMQLAEGEFTDSNDIEALEALKKSCSLAISESDAPCEFANEYISMIETEGNSVK